MASFSKIGVTAQSNPANKTNPTPGLAETDLKGVNQPDSGPRFSQYAPTNTSTTPIARRASGVSPRKKAEMSRVKTGLKVSNGVTSEASASWSDRAEARWARVLSVAEPSIPRTNSASTCGRAGRKANVVSASRGRARPITLQTTA